MNAASIDVKDMLDGDSSLGLTYKTDLFIAREPDSPDNVVTVYDTPSFPPEYTLAGQSEVYYRSSVQVRIRHNKYTTGMTLARNILDLLHARAFEVWNGTVYTVIEAAGEPAPLATDTSNRHIIIINFNLQRR